MVSLAAISVLLGEQIELTPREHTQHWFKSKIKRQPIDEEEEICLRGDKRRRVTDDYCRQIEMSSELNTHYPSKC